MRSSRWVVGIWLTAAVGTARVSRSILRRSSAAMSAPDLTPSVHLHSASLSLLDSVWHRVFLQICMRASMHSSFRFFYWQPSRTLCASLVRHAASERAQLSHLRLKLSCLGSVSSVLSMTYALCLQRPRAYQARPLGETCAKLVLALLPARRRAHFSRDQRKRPADGEQASAVNGCSRAE